MPPRSMARLSTWNSKVFLPIRIDASMNKIYMQQILCRLHEAIYSDFCSELEQDDFIMFREVSRRLRRAVTGLDG